MFVNPGGGGGRGGGGNFYVHRRPFREEKQELKRQHLSEGTAVKLGVPAPVWCLRPGVVISVEAGMAQGKLLNDLSMRLRIEH
jgi:hypothetical protein